MPARSVSGLAAWTRGRKRLLAVVWIAVVAVILVEIGLRLAVAVPRWLELRRYPDIAQRVSGTRQVMKLMTYRAVLDSIENFPAPVYGPEKEGSAAPEWGTFGTYPESGFRTLPPTDAPPPGVVRIAFFGESTTFNDYPDQVKARLEQRFGAGRIEIVNLGVPAGNTGTSLLFVKRFLGRWTPHLGVVYHGVNDLVYYTARARGTSDVFSGRASMDDPALAPAPPQGLLGLLRGGAAAPAPLHPWLAETIFQEPISNFWMMSRLAWAGGTELYVATFASPDYDDVSADELGYFDADIRFLWPVLGDRDAYARAIAEYRRRVVAFAAQAGVPVIDVAARLRGGRDLFQDNWHLTAAGRALHAEVVADALAPRVAELLAHGPPAPTPRAIGPAPPLAVPAGGLPADSKADGTCVRGPCPATACFVPGGTAHFGYDRTVLQTATDGIIAAIGFGDLSWYDDDGPAAEVVLSPFCIDRTEAPESLHAQCVAAGACPPVGERVTTPSERMPAVLPTSVDAEAYCAWHGGRLPTDAEWEDAARGPNGRVFPWGDKWTGREANFCGRECPSGLQDGPQDDTVGVAEIGHFPGTSPYGAVDMAGNLWEWAADCFMPHVRRFAGGVHDPIAMRDPVCRRFLRGGSFQSLGLMLEKRNAEGLPDIDIPGRGVRCAYDFGITHTPVTMQ